MDSHNLRENPPTQAKNGAKYLTTSSDLLGYSLEEQELFEQFFGVYAKQTDWLDRLVASKTTNLGFAAPGGRFTRTLYQAVLRDQLPLIPKFLKGRITVELGAGGLPFGYMLAHLCGAKAYIGIEPFYADALLTSIACWLNDKEQNRLPIPFTVLPLDMKAALRRFNANSVTIITCGIERCILPTHEYESDVETEVLRTLHPEGAFVTFRTDLHPQGLTSIPFQLRRPETGKVDSGFLRIRPGALERARNIDR